jgi:hypothetical protein
MLKHLQLNVIDYMCQWGGKACMSSPPSGSFKSKLKKIKIYEQLKAFKNNFFPQHSRVISKNSFEHLLNLSGYVCPTSACT